MIFYSKFNKQTKSYKNWIIDSKTETKTKRKKSSLLKIIFNTFNSLKLDSYSQFYV